MTPPSTCRTCLYNGIVLKYFWLGERSEGEYPTDCDVNEIGEALLARFVCHELLPADVHRVIAMDLADVLVLDDIKDLWAQFDTFEPHHVFAAAHITALSHVNGGLALYDLSRMRASNWTSIALKAARDGLERSHDCIHDQSLMNTIHLHRPRSDGLSPMKTLPCRWMLATVCATTNQCDQTWTMMPFSTLSSANP
eukprot:s664_g28.t1